MRINLTLTRRTAVLGVATLVAVGGAVAIGLSGNSAAPAANAGTTGTAILAPALAADTGPLAPDAFPGITVRGAGKVTGTPETAGDVTSAMNGLVTTMTAVQNSLKANHVADADQKTSGLGVGPEYDYSSSKRTVTGYQATENLTVTLRDTKAAGATISAAAAAGGDATQWVEESVSTQPNAAAADMMKSPAASGAAIAPVPIQMGSTDVTVQVTVVFSFS
ncbi:MAG: SIMPL domain-containing protein [Catenulisporales bacterium]|nr:SIMPL domain-containing protein [Catenulisporales bacterium]